MRPSRALGRNVSPAIALLALTACAGYTSVPLRELAEKIDVGDQLRVRTKAGVTSEFEVTEIEAAALAGVDTRVALADLAYVGVKSYKRTGWIVLGVIGGLALIEQGFCHDPAPSATPSEC
jgi:hypothetical protein